jgi:GxxExxY protein
VILELKAVERLDKIHEAQLHTYLRLTKLHLGLLMNFNVLRLVDGIKRVVYDFPD